MKSARAFLLIPTQSTIINRNKQDNQTKYEWVHLQKAFISIIIIRYANSISNWMEYTMDLPKR